MNRRKFLGVASIVAAPMIAVAAKAVPASQIEPPIGKWILIAENAPWFAWVMRTDGDFSNPYHLPKWIGRLYCCNTGHTVYSELSGSFEEVRMAFIEQQMFAFRGIENYTQSPWPEGSELAKNLGWNPNWKDKYKMLPKE